MDTLKMITMLACGFEYELKNSESEIEMEIPISAITGDEECKGQIKFTGKIKGDLSMKFDFNKE